MTVAFVDCWSGVPGDMLLGALLDLGWPLERLRSGLSRLPLDGARLLAEPARRGSLVGTRFFIAPPAPGVVLHPSAIQGHGVLLPQAHAHPHPPGAHGHDHGHRHGHDRAPDGAGGATRGLTEIEGLIQAAELPPAVTADALNAFRLLGAVEARAHGIPIEQVHFHEVGALDTLVDVCGVLLGFHELDIDTVFCSAVAVGSGTVQCEHGLLPVPAPGTLGLLSGVPIVSGGLTGERATPTGAALLRVLVDEFEPAALHWQPERSGLGAGTRDDPRVPNLLRVTLGRRAEAGGRETVLELTCQVDDVAGAVLGFAMERLFAAGALDVLFTPVQMKKNRPGTRITVLAPRHARVTLEQVLFAETGTLGVRCAELSRTVLARRAETRETEFGPVLCKVRTLPDGREVAVPEFEDLRRIALERGLAFAVVLERVSRSLASP